MNEKRKKENDEKIKEADYVKNDEELEDDVNDEESTLSKDRN